jgi:aminobenzoyl-glutamate utilization protein B
MSSAKSIALDWIKDNRDLIVDLSDRIWEFAELPMREFKSSRLIAECARIESNEDVQSQIV